MSESCIFCSIIEKKITSDVIAESDLCLAFKDVNPAADFHALIIPKMHVNSFSELSYDDAPYIAEMMFLAKDVAARYKLPSYRLVINSGKDAGQSVFHLHLHLLAGREFSWPPG